jgi:hypothetical protein
VPASPRLRAVRKCVRGGRAWTINQVPGKRFKFAAMTKIDQFVSITRQVFGSPL